MKKPTQRKPASTVEAGDIEHVARTPPAHRTTSTKKKVAAPRKKATTERASAPRAAPATPQREQEGSALRSFVEPGFESIRMQLRSMQQTIEQLVTPPLTTDAALDASVDSLRRLLSELIEQRMESVVRDIVDVRRDAANLAGEGGARVAERLDQLLEDLGAMRFEAEPTDVVDPLIHVVVGEGAQANMPDGVIIETRRPGYRTARGMVLCKAGVVVNRRA